MLGQFLMSCSFISDMEDRGKDRKNALERNVFYAEWNGETTCLQSENGCAP